MAYGFGSKKKKVVDKENEEIAVFVEMKEVNCLTCKRMNRKQKIINGICMTCRQGNRKQEIV